MGHELNNYMLECTVLCSLWIAIKIHIRIYDVEVSLLTRYVQSSVLDRKTVMKFDHTLIGVFGNHAL